MGLIYNDSKVRAVVRAPASWPTYRVPLYSQTSDSLEMAPTERALWSGTSRQSGILYDLILT